MTGQENQASGGEISERQEWTAPVIRETIPVRHTAGGGGDINNQDDIFYVTS